MTHAYTAHAVYAFARVITDIRIAVKDRELLLYTGSRSFMIGMFYSVAVAHVLKFTGSVGGTAHAVQIMIGKDELKHILSVLCKIL